jgi:simple sugar transport system ATP-binding protein
MAALLELKQVAMNYGSVKALKGVDLCVNAGDVLGVCGDNGAGKSTMIKVISGAIKPSKGQLFLKGDPVRFASPKDALEKGVATIYQDLALAPRLPIYQNVFMGSELVRKTFVPGISILDRAAMREQSAGYLASLKLTIPSMDTWVNQLSGGQRQAVAISRALRWSACLVVMDEPTAALGVRETAKVLDLIRSLRDSGVTVILISHNMEDVVAVTNRVMILKSGLKIAERKTCELTADSLAHLVMSGAQAQV